MATNRRLRTRLIWSSVLIIFVLGLAGFVFREPLSLQYHKRRLIAAKARHWRLTTQGYAFWDHVAEIARGRPVSADEVVEIWKRHEEALVRRGFLKQQTFVAKEGVLPSRSTDRAYNDALAQMEATCRWWSVSRVGTNLLVTASPQGLAAWKLLAPKVGLINKENLAQSSEKAQKKRCWRKRKKSRHTETLTASRSAGYIVDDESVRVFLARRGRVAGGLQP